MFRRGKADARCAAGDHRDRFGDKGGMGHGGSWARNRAASVMAMCRSDDEQHKECADDPIARKCIRG
jgi:hypothetical protein